MNVLITGAGGFIGQNLSAYLISKGKNISSFSLRNQTPAKNLCEEVDAVVHLAGLAHDVKHTQDAEEYFKVNTQLTQQLTDQFIQSEARDFIFVSSVKAIADTTEQVLSEASARNPSTAYGLSKYKAEQYLQKMMLQYPHKRFFILRPCMVYGSGNKGNMELLYKFLKMGLPYPLAAFNNKRSYCNVRNLCFAIEALLDNKNILSNDFIIADDEPLTTMQLVAILNREIGKKNRNVKIPAFLIKCFSKFNDILNLPFSSERLHKLTENYVVSNQKIKTTLGLSAMPFDIEMDIQDVISTFEERARNTVRH